MRAFPPFQAARQGGTQTIKRGSMNRPDGRCNTISILRDANDSTGIHELAHDWLVRFLTDSEHELATAGLKEDGQTVLKWLGAEKASDLIYRDTDTKAEKAAKTKMHEKWARAYETYYREGRAPTSALKAIFERVRLGLPEGAHGCQFRHDLATCRGRGEFRVCRAPSDPGFARGLLLGRLSSHLGPSYWRQITWEKAPL